MTKLNPELFGPFETNYDKRREHSEKLDQVLGIEVEKIENELLRAARELDPKGSHRTWGQGLHQGNQTWVGLSHQTLQTPYGELKEICDLLNPLPGQKVLDLGAGYGRLGLVLGTFYPEVYFLGYEYVSERVKEGSRIFKQLHCEQAQLLVQDLTADDFKLPEADFYFLYDYGNIGQIRHTLNQLAQIEERKKFKLVGRGKGTRSLIQHEYPWLAEIYPVIHREQFSIYSTY